MRGKYQVYLTNKESGEGWCGKVPCEWGVQRTKWLFEIKKRIAGELGHSILSITQKGIKVKDTESGEGQLSMDYSKYQLVYVGDFAMNHMDLLTGYVDISKFGGVTIPDYRVFRSKNDSIIDGYFLYLFQMAYINKIYFPLGQGSSHLGRWRLPTEGFYDFRLPVPPKDEQEAIANFLDHETAKIDILIDKQQQLIKLLKEKRQAVISHAVTKGLNPDAPMKDSGVEWLGEVPGHWVVKPLKYLCRISGGGTPSKDNQSYWENGDIPWVSPKDMRTFWVAETQDKLTKMAVEESSTNYVEPGALLMVVRSGILQRKIPVAINKVQVTLNQDMKAIRFNSEMNVNFAANFVLGYQNSLLLEWAKQGATVESIEHEYLANSLIPVPPWDEQITINQSIEEKMAVLDTLSGKAVDGIVLLQERRTALISAAVTGKIDVRNWQPEHSEPRMDATA